MASDGRIGGDSTGDYEGAKNDGVRELLVQHFQKLSSAAEVLFESGAEDFGIFHYSAAVSNIVNGSVGGGGENSHDAAVVWVAASFLLCQKLIRTAAAMDAALSSTSPTKIDLAMLYKYCGKETSTNAFNCPPLHASVDVVGQLGDAGAARKRSPTRASSPLSIKDIQLMYQANMRLLGEYKLYEAYTGVICALARETVATPLASVAVHVMIGIASVACSTFVKVAAAAYQLNLPPGCKDGGDYTAFPKEDVSADVLQTLTGPLYGHSPLIAVNAAMCGSFYDSKTGEIDWPGSLEKYEQNLIWLLDWDVPGRPNDTLASKVGTMLTPCKNGVEPKLDSSGPLITIDRRVSGEKNRVGCLVARWDTKTENSLVKGRVRKLPRHSGWLCGVPDMVREIILATAGYYQYGCWPSGDWKDVQSLWCDVAACIGSMTKGWVLDHDTEADIGEHNAMNWLCKTCASASTNLQRTPRGRTEADPVRSVRAQRLSWGPSTYFYYSKRHSGLARRIYSRKFRSLPGVQWGAVTLCSDFLESIAEPEGPLASTGTIVLHILRLTGITVDDTNLSRICNAMPDLVDATMAGMCADCLVDGIGLEMTMYGHGIMIIAAMLPESARRKFVWEVEGYGGRAFPTLYSRILSGCTCSPYWLEEVLQLGYNLSLSPCGSDTCDTDNYGPSVVVPVPEESGSDWLKSARTSENLQILMAACKQQFESMPTIRDQIQSGRLKDSWSVLSCAGKVRAMLESR